MMAICPECETALDVDEEELDEGEIVSCPECGSDFEVVTKNPLELNPVEEYEEDEEEEGSDEEDEDSEYRPAPYCDHRRAGNCLAGCLRPALHCTRREAG